MKILLISVFVLFFGFSPVVFAETEMTGWLRIMDSYSTDPGPHPYILWFKPDKQTISYRLNPNTVSSAVLDWSGERVKVTVDDTKIPLASSFNPNEQFLDITSINLIQKPLENTVTQQVSSIRSVTLLSKFSNVATIPSESANTGPGQFKGPVGITVDISGNVYVVDSNNHRIQKFDPNGVFLLKFGTNGSADGQFISPSGVAVDNLGNIYVTDTGNHRIQKFDPNGVFLLKFGTNGSGNGQFNQPFGIAVDSSNNVYVADNLNHRIQKFDQNGLFLLKFGSFGGGNGQFASPLGVTVDTSGNIFVADTGVSRIQKFNSAGSFQLKFGSNGTSDGQFYLPRGVAVDSSGNIYVADTGNNRIQKFNSAGSFQLKFGSLGSGNNQFNSTQGISIGSIFVSDKNNDRLKKFDSNGNFISEIGYDGSLTHDQTYYEGIFYNNPGSLKNYYLTSSYGDFTWNGNVTNWTTLPQIQNIYSNPSNFDLMVTDAIAIHEPTVDFCNPTPVTNLILVFNGAVSPSVNSAFGSLGTWPNAPQSRVDWPTADGCFITISVSWEPDNGGFFCCGQTLDRGIGVTAHELGHNLGFEHTPPPPGLWVGSFSDPYHDPNSVMSNNKDREGPSPLISSQRDDVGWIDIGNKITITDGNSATVTLDFINESDAGANPQMIIVPLPDNTSYIIEGRTEGLFSDTPQDRTGAIIYRDFFPIGNQYSYLTQTDKGADYSLVATAGTDTESQFDQAILEVGETFTDNTNNVTVTTLSKTATSVTVFVSNDAVTCATPPGLDWTISSSCTLTQNVTADRNIIIQNGSVLTVPNGKTLSFHGDTYHITIQSGGGLLIEQGGKVQSIP